MLNEELDDRSFVLQMNSELRHAQLELLSAHCATHQLRLRYSASDLARFGRRDVLRKSAEAASVLNEFYTAIKRQMSERGNTTLVEPSEQQIAQAVRWLAAYLQTQRAAYLPPASPLDPQSRSSLEPYFSPALLDRIRVLELKGARVNPPDFFAEVRALGFDNLPEISHMDSLTFLDVIVFNQEASHRALFHGLVHTVQIELLGLERYCELWVSGFISSRAHFTVPLEVHAFALASKYLRSLPEQFSVEEQVALWISEDRY